MLFGKPLSSTPPAGTPGVAPYSGPAATPAPTAAATAAPAEPTGPLILLVDDSTMVRTMVAKTLTTHRFGVMQADGGQLALDLWEKNKGQIKLVLSDVFMPGMDGLTFAKHLRQRSRTLPIILMSSKLDDDSRWIAEEAGFRLLAKPFKDELLIETINRMLRLAYPS